MIVEDLASPRHRTFRDHDSPSGDRLDGRFEQMDRKVDQIGLQVGEIVAMLRDRPWRS